MGKMTHATTWDLLLSSQPNLYGHLSSIPGSYEYPAPLVSLHFVAMRLQVPRIDTLAPHSYTIFLKTFPRVYDMSTTARMQLPL